MRCEGVQLEASSWTWPGQKKSDNATPGMTARDSFLCVQILHTSFLQMNTKAGINQNPVPGLACLPSGFHTERLSWDNNLFMVDFLIREHVNTSLDIILARS